MKTLYLTAMFLFSSLAVAQTPPNDSCAIHVQYGEKSYWYCDAGILEAKKNSVVKVSSKTWSKIIEKLKVESDQSSANEMPRPTNVKVPNDSCAIGFKLGSEAYFRCDDGLYMNSIRGYAKISAADWNKKVAQIPTGGSEVEIDDGALIKDISVSQSRTRKELKQNDPKIKTKSSSGSGH